VGFRKINCAPSIRPDLAVSGVSRPLAISSVVVELTAPLLRVFPTVLFCLTLTGTASAGGPVVGWGWNVNGEVTPPTPSTAFRRTRPTSRWAASSPARSRRARATSSAGAPTSTARLLPPTPSMEFWEPRPTSRRVVTILSQLSRSPSRPHGWHNSQGSLFSAPSTDHAPASRDNESLFL
jgi:hypothetical protein